LSALPPQPGQVTQRVWILSPQFGHAFVRAAARPRLGAGARPPGAAGRAARPAGGGARAGGASPMRAAPGGRTPAGRQARHPPAAWRHRAQPNAGAGAGALRGRRVDGACVEGTPGTHGAAAANDASSSALWSATTPS